MVTQLDVRVPQEQSHKADRSTPAGREQYLQLILAHWMPISATLLPAVVKHVHSPAAAQQYRVGRLFEGTQLLDKSAQQSLLRCDARGPLILTPILGLPMPRYEARGEKKSEAS